MSEGKALVATNRPPSYGTSRPAPGRGHGGVLPPVRPPHVRGPHRDDRLDVQRRPKAERASGVPLGHRGLLRAASRHRALPDPRPRRRVLTRPSRVARSPGRLRTTARASERPVGRSEPARGRPRGPAGGSGGSPRPRLGRCEARCGRGQSRPEVRERAEPIRSPTATRTDPSIGRPSSTGNRRPSPRADSSGGDRKRRPTRLETREIGVTARPRSSPSPASPSPTSHRPRR